MANIVNLVERRNWVPGYRKDPYLTFNFVVEIDGIAVAGFTDVSGLSIETQVERKTFGGENHKEYTFLTQTKYSDITLKHGITNDDYLWNWYRRVINGRITRKNGSICLLDHSGNPKLWWDFLEACPIKWEGPAFSATSSSIAAETLVFTHNGINMHK
ncbi:phage tail protein [Ruminiclostridium papyrosolvens]|uniref:Phage tail protein n=1 Tax=Ruminiclostridium papyrosolvens C7 TaxID=1330534 RepID=U4R0J2_9FIRM|nr:phage tail protein [Ruminiclostridium papyrosolvens]EPR11629.1 phage tail protein [Ruminiclostridium papyrosolvens C7]